MQVSQKLCGYKKFFLADSVINPPPARARSHSTTELTKKASRWQGEADLIDKFKPNAWYQTSLWLCS